MISNGRRADRAREETAAHGRDRTDRETEEPVMAAHRTAQAAATSLSEGDRPLSIMARAGATVIRYPMKSRVLTA